MAKINILTSEVFNLIAAGEVVERPASVVKELVENSIDAGAKSIIIEIEEGGIKQIKVIDNGDGIESTELAKALLPHSTSKIKTANDLEKIGTLGFRGEALASIAAVSKIEITSCTKQSEIGASINAIGGEIGNVVEKGSNKGTMIVVRDLFFNIPARAKFLKKEKSEESEITNLVSRFILANPLVAFKYIVSGKTVFQSTGKSLEDALICVYGKEITTNIISVSKEFNDIKISGYIGKPTFSKPNRTYQTIVLNGRFIQNLTIQTAVQNAYGDFLMKRQYPFYVLQITMPVSEVDVNVHPNKMDVRFSASINMYSKVFESVVRSLHSIDLVPASLDENSSNKIGLFEKNAEQKPLEKAFSTAQKLFNSSAVAQSASSALFEQFKSSLKNSEQIDKTTGEVIQSFEEFKTQTSKHEQVKLDFDINYKLVGKLFSTYLVIEQSENAFFIDQHAAHERLLFDELENEVNEKTLSIQPLLIPFIFETNAIETEIINENKNVFSSLGFEIEEFGKNAFKVNSMPVMLSNIDLSTFISEALSESKGQKELKRSDLIKEKLMQTACKAAVKAGNDLSEKEIKMLLKSMGDGKTPLRCPHGRPAVIKISKDEIEKWFKRVI